MRAVLLALVLATFSVPAAAQDTRRAASTASTARAVVLVVDPGHARINPERLLRTLSSTLGRDLVRITDARAGDAAGTLTLAHESRGRWLVRFDATGGSASALAEIARPGLYDVTLAETARRVVAEVEAAVSAVSAVSAPAASSPAAPRAQAPHGDRMYIGWADEILDPFADLPPPPRRELAIATEVIDPFAPIAARHTTFSEVLDPWGR